MDKAPAGAGVNDTGEFLALSIPYDELLTSYRSQAKYSGELQSMLLEVLELLHHWNHGTVGSTSKGAHYTPPTWPWEQCRHVTCRKVKAVLLGSEGEG